MRTYLQVIRGWDEGERASRVFNCGTPSVEVMRRRWECAISVLSTCRTTYPYCFAGMMTMATGESARFTMTADYAYGPEGFPAWGIPPNATLIFEVEMLAC